VVFASVPNRRALAIPGRFCVARRSYDPKFLGIVSSAGLRGTDNSSRRREGQATPEQSTSEPAAQRSERRRREISYRRMPAGREVLEIFQDAGVHAEAADDLYAASAHAVACRSNGGRPSVGNEMLESAGKPGSYHVLSRQQGQDGEENDAAPSQNPKRRHEEVSPHTLTFIDGDGSGKYVFSDAARSLGTPRDRLAEITRHGNSAELPCAFSVRPILNPCSIGFIPGSTG
jgi:hypothetical protein